MKFVAPKNLPAALADRWQTVEQRLADFDGPAPPEVLDTLPRVALVSDFVLAALLRQPGRLVERLADRARLDETALREALALDGATEADAMSQFRRLRQVELARIAWRDLAGWADLGTCLEELSMLADGMVRIALDYAVESLVPRFGRPHAADGRGAPLLVLAMGKLGGRELNYSSDIDLVLLRPDGIVFEQGEALEAEDYFRRLGQALIRLLDQVTNDGFVFRVDTRLRPFGDSGPLVVGISAFESYLVRHGRDWERYAYVKARLVTGEEYRDDVFDQILTPFVYRRYLDFGVFDALRQMKRLITREVERKDMADNIKLGPGGVREIEFIVQALQLVRAGRDPLLRSSALLEALPALVARGHLDAAAAERLREAYAFLRTTENRLQAMDDQQTHELPVDREHRDRLAYSMGMADWPALDAALDAHRQAVASEFDQVAWESQKPNSRAQSGEAYRSAWESGAIAAALAESPLAGDAEALRMLAELREGGLYERMDEPSRQRLAQVVVRLLPLLEAREDAGVVLTRILPVLRAICRRSAYLSLLDENPQALERLLSLAAQSAILTRQIADHPLLLDELLDARLFDTPPSREELELELEQQLSMVGTGDVEAALEAVRLFQRTAVFRIAIADRFGNLPLMKVSDRLTDTAELVLRFAYESAYRELVAKHGEPSCGEPPELERPGFAIIGYGKLGGYELGYGSDLDIVFMHDSSGPHQETDGAKPLDNARFFARLAQRLIHFLSIQTSSGRLYEVDTRLRPSGGAGLMVASMTNFKRYQREAAWTWEHQALLRSRAVAGADAVCAAFERERLEILVAHVKRDTLQQEIAKMRARMREQLSQSEAGQFDIKQDDGGLADIEFLIDYWVLAHAHEHPELVRYPDNIRQLEALERVGLVEAERCAGLKDAYIALRQRSHELALDDRKRVVPENEFAEVQAFVRGLWDEALG